MRATGRVVTNWERQPAPSKEVWRAVLAGDLQGEDERLDQARVEAARRVSQRPLGLPPLTRPCEMSSFAGSPTLESVASAPRRW